MPANVETMFYVRETPWHGLGTRVESAPTSENALRMAGLEWTVEQKSVHTPDGSLIHGYKANIRSSDDSVLGIVSNRYKVVQNEEAFRFTDELLGEGLVYETAGALQGGRKVWILARMPESCRMAGDEIMPYLVFMNSHDGSSGIKVAMTPIRVVCQNTLNLALSHAKRTWAARHTESIHTRLQEDREPLFLADRYMQGLNQSVEKLCKVRLSERQAEEYMKEFFPTSPELSDNQIKNNLRLLDDMRSRYHAPDVVDLGQTAYRFINAVSDFATHSKPLRRTKNYKENLFLRTVEGNPLIDKAYRMVQSAA